MTTKELHLHDACSKLEELRDYINDEIFPIVDYNIYETLIDMADEVGIHLEAGMR